MLAEQEDKTESVENSGFYGVHKLDFRTYKAIPAVNQSKLTTLLQESALHLKNEIDNPSEPTPSMLLGQLIHTLVSEEHLFDQQYVVEPKFSGTGSRGAREEFALINADKTIITQKMHETARAAVKSLKGNRRAWQLLGHGQSEMSFFWKDPETGTDCKGRADNLRSSSIIVDLKTTQCASFAEFQRAVASYMIHLQGAYYLDGATIATGQRFDSFVVVALETKPPYGVAIYALDEATIEKGRELGRRALRQYSECLASGIWPGYSEEIQPMNLPAWAWGV